MWHVPIGNLDLIIFGLGKVAIQTRTTSPFSCVSLWSGTATAPHMRGIAPPPAGSDRVDDEAVEDRKGKRDADDAGGFAVPSMDF